MPQRHWQWMVFGVGLWSGLWTLGHAQDIPVAATARPTIAKAIARDSARTRSGRGGFGFMASLDKAVVLTPEQRDSVRGLLAQQREQMKAVREQTDVKIRTLLNPDQQKKFDAMLAEQKAQRGRNNQGA